MSFSSQMPSHISNFVSVTYKCPKHGWFDIKPKEFKNAVIGYGKPEMKDKFRDKEKNVYFDKQNRAICPIESCNKKLNVDQQQTHIGQTSLAKK